jgi:hypothetical protein
MSPPSRIDSTNGVELEAEIAERRAVAAERQAALAKKLAKLSD